MNARGQSGFTLVELMVALTVVIVLLVIATPSFAEYFERSRVRGAAEDALAALVHARQGAVEEDRNVRVTVGGTTGAWCLGAVQAQPASAGLLVESVPDECDCASTPGACLVGGDRVVATGAGRRGVEVATASLATDFTFDSKAGTLRDLGQPVIDFVSSSRRYGLRIEMNALGHARICNFGTREVQGFSSCS